MAYQLCRWYDTYPRLAFALKLLYFAPQEMRNLAARELTKFLGQQLGPDPNHPPGEPRLGNRWYDESDETAYLVELLRQSPDGLKTLSADRLIRSLTQPSPC